jgi:glycosyltransferase involved in cell wall biosynthesis
MKLLVQIPCYNEESTLPLVIKSIPKYIDGIDTIETLVIDDGSTDRTVEVARELGVTHIVQHRNNKGLALSFIDGIHASLQQGADIIVNTDADNQYPQGDIPKLIQPILDVLDGKADMVVGDRQTAKIAHFSKLKKTLQWFGSAVVRKLSNTSIPDAVSGFRAYSKEAAMQLNVVTDFSYVIETIMQANHKRLAITSIPVVTNPPTRKSRLFKNMGQHIQKSTAAIIRSFTMYRPLFVFMVVGATMFYAGITLALRFGYYYLLGQGNGHLQSLLLASILIIVGFQIGMTGLVADLIAINRKLAERSLNKLKQMEIKAVEQTKKIEKIIKFPEDRIERNNHKPLFA